MVDVGPVNMRHETVAGLKSLAQITGIAASVVAVLFLGAVALGEFVPAWVLLGAITVAALAVIASIMLEDYRGMLLRIIAVNAMLHGIFLVAQDRSVGLDSLYELGAVAHLEIQAGGWPGYLSALPPRVAYVASYPALHFLTVGVETVAGPLGDGVIWMPVAFHTVALLSLAAVGRRIGLGMSATSFALLGFAVSNKVFLIGFVRQVPSTVLFFVYLLLFVLYASSGWSDKRFLSTVIIVSAALVLAHNLTPLVVIAFLGLWTMAELARGRSGWRGASLALAIATTLFVALLGLSVYLNEDLVLKAYYAFRVGAYQTGTGERLAGASIDRLATYALFFVSAVSAALIAIRFFPTLRRWRSPLALTGGIWIASAVALQFVAEIPLLRLMPFLWPLAVFSLCASTASSRLRHAVPALMVIYIASSFAGVPGFLIDASETPDASHGKHTLVITKSEYAAARWLTPTGVVVGGLPTSRLLGYTDRYDVTVDVGLLEVGRSDSGRPADWIVVTPADERLLIDEETRRWGRFTESGRQVVEDGGSFMRVYDGGYPKIYRAESLPSARSVL